MLYRASRNILPTLRAWMTPGQPLVCRTDHRVRLAHLSLGMHLNQAVYAEISEQERLRWMLQSGAHRRWRQAGRAQVVARQDITYRHALPPLQRYTVDTRAVHIEGRLLWFEQHFLVGAKVCARNRAALLLTEQGRALSAAASAEAFDGLLTAPLSVADWQAQEAV